MWRGGWAVRKFPVIFFSPARVWVGKITFSSSQAELRVNIMYIQTYTASEGASATATPHTETTMVWKHEQQNQEFFMARIHFLLKLLPWKRSCCFCWRGRFLLVQFVFFFCVREWVYVQEEFSVLGISSACYVRWNKTLWETMEATRAFNFCVYGTFQKTLLPHSTPFILAFYYIFVCRTRFSDFNRSFKNIFPIQFKSSRFPFSAISTRCGEMLNDDWKLRKLYIVG